MRAGYIIPQIPRFSRNFREEIEYSDGCFSEELALTYRN